MVETTINTYGITPFSYDLLLNSFSNFDDINEVILFGSRAKGNYKNGSDIDIAVITDRYETILKLSTYLNQVAPIPYTIDVAMYNTLDNNIKEHIQRIGKTIYKN